MLHKYTFSVVKNLYIPNRRKRFFGRCSGASFTGDGAVLQCGGAGFPVRKEPFPHGGRGSWRCGRGRTALQESLFCIAIRSLRRCPTGGFNCLRNVNNWESRYYTEASVFSHMRPQAFFRAYGPFSPLCNAYSYVLPMYEYAIPAECLSAAAAAGVRVPSGIPCHAVVTPRA